MSREITWTAWSFRIASKAYKNIQPLSLEIEQEMAISSTSGMLWWKKDVVEKTGRWILVFRYSRGPGTLGKIDRITFERESDARFWFNQTYESVFLDQRAVMPPLPPKPKKTKKKDNHLTLL